MRLKGGRDDDVLSWWQFKAPAHLAQVYEGVAHGDGPLTQQNIRTQVDVVATFILQDACRDKNRKSQVVIIIRGKRNAADY